MADQSKIQWTDATWNPIAGCDLVSPGCTNCYAMRRVAPRLAANPATPHYKGTVKKTKAGYVWTGKIGIASDKVFDKPLHWRKGRKIFVDSTSDLFHPGVPDAVRDRVFAVAMLSPQHIFQILTKRPEAMAAYVADPGRAALIAHVANNLQMTRLYRTLTADNVVTSKGLLPLANIWLGTSVENQTWADARLEPMRALAGRGWTTFVSYEPALGEVDWRGWEFHAWLIAGGESGPGWRASVTDWHRIARDWCAESGIAFFMKQIADGKPEDWMIPADLLVRQFPEGV